MSCYVPTLNIVKLVNGNVEFYDAVTGGFIKMLSADIVRIEIVGDSVTIIQDNGSIERIHKDNVVNTQILPAAAVAFAGTAADLAALLSASFFASTDDSLTVIEENVISKINRIQGAANYSRALTYDLVGTENILTVTHTGTTSVGVETIVETITYVNPAINGSNITNIVYS